MAPVEKRGKTFVCDKEKCVVGNFKPMGSGTAHERLARASGIDPAEAVGGSIKPDGRIELRSESINRNRTGDCDASGTAEGEQARERIAAGDYQTRGRSRSKSRS